MTRAPPRSGRATYTCGHCAPDSLGGASGSFFALKDAKHSRAAAGHQGSDSAVLFQRGLDGLVISGTAAFLQRVACGGTHTRQILGADRFFLGFAVGVGAAAHFVISGKGFRGGNAVIGHDHREPAVRAGRQGF